MPNPQANSKKYFTGVFWRAGKVTYLQIEAPKNSKIPSPDPAQKKEGKTTENVQTLWFPNKLRGCFSVSLPLLAWVGGGEFFRSFWGICSFEVVWTRSRQITRQRMRCLLVLQPLQPSGEVPNGWHWKQLEKPPKKVLGKVPKKQMKNSRQNRQNPFRVFFWLFFWLFFGFFSGTLPGTHSAPCSGVCLAVFSVRHPALSRAQIAILVHVSWYLSACGIWGCALAIKLSAQCRLERGTIGPGGFASMSFLSFWFPLSQKIDTKRKNICLLFIECFRGRHRGGPILLLRFSGTFFSCSKMSLFYLKTCTPVKEPLEAPLELFRISKAKAKPKFGSLIYHMCFGNYDADVSMNAKSTCCSA